MIRAAIIGAAFLVCSACEPTERSADQPAATIDKVSTASTAPASSTSMPITIDPRLVQTCVEFTQFAAFIGDAEMLQFWNDAGQDADVLAARCAELPAGELAEIAARQAETDAFLEAAAAAATTTLPPPTTAAPPPPTTVASAPLPFVSLPAAAPARNCNPNYEGACVPNASDVDCAGGSGDGPEYVSGPVYVVGGDPYGLDRDGDGVGCQS